MRWRWSASGEKFEHNLGSLAISLAIWSNVFIGRILMGKMSVLEIRGM
jgi:hypothetical protein